MAEPLWSSSVSGGVRRGFGEEGAGRLGFVPKPVQVEVWDLLDTVDGAGVPLHQESVVEVPRRAGKTSALFALCVGRCAALEGYQVAYCAQTGQKSRERFYGLLRDLQRHDPSGGWRKRESRGEERIEWGNGSVLRFLPPKPSSFRGDALDMVVLDESQEHDPTETGDLLGAVMPVFDTVPGYQLVVAGTAGALRSGLLWDSLELGRRGGSGILEYAVGDADLVDVDLDDEELWQRVHPGIGSLTTLDVIRKRRARLGPEEFAREYLGLWPRGASMSAFALEVWQRCGTERRPVPSRHGLAFDVTPDGSRAALVAGWRDAQGAPHVRVLDERPGTSWLAPEVLRYGRVNGLRDVGYDSAGSATLAVADEVARLDRSGRLRLRGLTTAQYAASCAVFSAAVLDGSLRHARQPDLDAAIEVASRRPIGDGGWGWGRKASTGAIHTLVAATVAVRVADDLPPAPVGRVMVARTA